MTARREEGLCYNCNKKLHENCKYKAKFLLMLVDDDEISSESNMMQQQQVYENFQ